MACAKGVIREFMKLQLLLHRKHRFKIVLPNRLSVVRLFHAGHCTEEISDVFFHVIGTNGFHIEEENERFSVVVRVVARSSTLKISRRRLADYVKI